MSLVVISFVVAPNALLAHLLTTVVQEVLVEELLIHLGIVSADLTPHSLALAFDVVVLGRVLLDSESHLTVEAVARLSAACLSLLRMPFVQISATVA